MLTKFSIDWNDKARNQPYLLDFNLESNNVIGAELALKLHRSTFWFSNHQDEPEQKDCTKYQKKEKLHNKNIGQESIPEKPNLKSQKTVVQPVEIPCSWPECNKILYQLEDLEAHLKIHTEGLLQCNYCNRQFNFKSDLQSHVRIHTGEKPYSCSICSKSFAYQDVLRIHLRIHTGEKPYNCSLCSKSFTQRGNLQSHMRTHNGDKPFNCSFCGKSFAQNGNLNTHMRTHTSKKIQQNKRLEMQTARIRDSKVSTNVPSRLQAQYDEPSTKQSLTCQECTLVCSTLEQLCKHYSTVHGLPKIILFSI